MNENNLDQDFVATPSTDETNAAPTTFIPRTQTFISDTAPQQIKWGSLRFLSAALMLDLVGFGTCSLVLSEESFLVLPSAMYLIAAFLGLMAIIRVLKEEWNIFIKIFISLFALVIGGWGAFWGSYGMLIAL